MTATTPSARPPLRAKLLGDLRAHRARAITVMLAILVGATAATAALGARAVLAREVPRSFLSTVPPSAVLHVGDVGPALLARARALPGVQQADARRLVRLRVQVAPGDWRPLLLYAMPELGSVRVARVAPLHGATTPATGALLVERSALPVLDPVHGAVPRTLDLRLPGGVRATLRVAGLAHDAAQAPGWQDNVAYGYTTPATLARLGLGDHLDELLLVIDGDRARAAAVAEAVAQSLARDGIRVQRIEVPRRAHPHADHMRTMLILVTTFGLLALALAGALTTTVVTALLARQRREIGIMKTIGATRATVTALALRFVLALAIPAVSIGTVAGTLTGRRFAALIADQLNLTVADPRIPLATLVGIVALSLGVPIVATIVPAWRASRIPVREAIADAPAAAVAVPILRRTGGDVAHPLALRNLFRHPSRLALTVGALALGGAALLTAANVYRSLERAVDDTLARRGDDIDARLLSQVAAAPLVARIAGLADVRRVEAWGTTLASIAVRGAEARHGRAERAAASAPPATSRRYSLLAPPRDGRLLRLPVTGGRWLTPDDRDAVVVNGTLRGNSRAYDVGTTLDLVVASAAGVRRRTVRVVGTVEAIEEPALYTTPTVLASLVPGADTLTGSLRIVTAPGAEARVATMVEEAIVEAGALPLAVFTRPVLRRTIVDHFRTMLTVLATAAAASILVGILALGTTIALATLERRRELAVARALGAARGTLRRLLVIEGVAAASLATGAAIVIALPLTALVNAVIGRHGLFITVPFAIAPWALAVWVVLAPSVAVIASLVPAAGALARPVREVLAGE
ncbi:MAG: ABC transporter permease [Gemmatimonadaceae bacterium]|jgi:putative ABC transport system permease protein|nr:ABC transporter permease [Gemmatimonadaceae bacterium]